MSENIVIRVRAITFGELIEEALQAEDAGEKDLCLRQLFWRNRKSNLWNAAAARTDAIGFVFGKMLGLCKKPKISESISALLHYTVIVPKPLKIALSDTISCEVDTFIIEILKSLVGPKNVLKTRFEEKPDFRYWDFWVFPEKDGHFVGDDACSPYSLVCLEEDFNDKLLTIARVLGWDKILLSEKVLSAVVISQPEETEN